MRAMESTKDLSPRGQLKSDRQSNPHETRKDFRLAQYHSPNERREQLPGKSSGFLANLH